MSTVFVRLIKFWPLMAFFIIHLVAAIYLYLK